MYKTSVSTNKQQNQLDFELEPIIQQASLFKYKLFERILNPPKENQEDIRTCTVKCLYKNCR
jgi:hypothetical protein